MSTLIFSDAKLLIKSIRNIFQKFMTREVVLMFTSVKQTGEKKVFKDQTTFYTCIRGTENFFFKINYVL